MPGWWSSASGVQGARAFTATATGAFGAAAAFAATAGAATWGSVLSASLAVLGGFALVVLTLREQTLPRAWARRYAELARDDSAGLLGAKTVPSTSAVVGRDDLCDVIADTLTDRTARRPHLVLGRAGSGKTAVLIRLAERLAGRDMLPVPVSMRDTGASLRLSFLNLGRTRFSEVCADTWGLAESEIDATWRQALRDGRIVILVDALEEAAADRAAYELVAVLEEAFRDAHRQGLAVVAASRPSWVLDSVDAERIAMEPLSEQAAIGYLNDASAHFDEGRARWIVEAGKVTEQPFYLRLAHDLAACGERVDIRQRDVVGGLDPLLLRRTLGDAWARAFVDGHLQPQVPIPPDQRLAALDVVAGLALVGLLEDSSVVPIVWDSLPRALRTEFEARCHALGSSVDAAVTNAARLGLVELDGGSVRFVQSDLESYLATRFMDVALDDGGYWSWMMTNSGRPLLDALVMTTRSRTTERNAKLVDLLVDSARRLSDSRRLAPLVTALEIDAVADGKAVPRIADELRRAPEPAAAGVGGDAEVREIVRIGRGGRALVARGRREAHDAYRELHRLARDLEPWRARLAALRELGEAGDAAFDALEEQPDGDEVLDWLAPVFIVTTDARRDGAARRLERTVRRGEDGLPAARQIALAFGFRDAANRRSLPAAYAGLLGARADDLLRVTDVWLARLALLHALCLLTLTLERGASPDSAARVRKSLSTPREGEGEDPLAAAAGELVTRALETGEPERFVWIDEAEAVGQVGSRPDERRERDAGPAVWIPRSTGWRALDPRARELLADVVLLRNMTVRGGTRETADKRFAHQPGEDSPLCLTRERGRLVPRRSVGMAERLGAGAECIPGCDWRLCPYPAKGELPYEAELSTSFCRDQRHLIEGQVGRRVWKPASHRELRGFWAAMESRART